MKFSLGLQEPSLEHNASPGSCGIRLKLNGELAIVSPERDMKAEMQMLEAQYDGLQTLVGELLVTNQLLRMQVDALKKLVPSEKAIELATHPQPHPGR